MVMLIATLAAACAETPTQSTVVSETPAETAAEVSVANLKVASGQPYVLVNRGLRNGATVYVDASYTFHKVPSELQGFTYIQTADADKTSRGIDEFLTFSVDRDVVVYVAYDDAETPSWISGAFTPTGLELSLDRSGRGMRDKKFYVFSKDFTAGTVVLGSNREGDRDSDMYLVAVAPRSSSPVKKTPVAVASVTITPKQDTVAVGDSVRLTAVALDADGNRISGVSLSWSSSDSSVASVNSSGLVKAASAGSAAIKASVDGTAVSGTAAVSVPAEPNAASKLVVTVSPQSSTLNAIGDSEQLKATVRDSQGNPVDGATVTWRSLHSDVAAVDVNGKVISKAVGVALITATSGSSVDTATIQSRQVVAAVAVTPATGSVAVGETLRFAAAATDSNGVRVEGARYAWSSSNTGVATVASTGETKGIAAGSATVKATAEGKSGSASLTVTASAISPPPPGGGGGNGIWISAAEIAKLPTSGAAWNNVKRAADTNLRSGVLTNRDDNNVRTMAAALVAARLDDDTYRAKVRDALRDIVRASVDRGDVLAAARRLGTYAISADLIDLSQYDPAFDGEFRTWLRQMRDLQYDGGGGGGSLVSVHERRPNNFGTNAGASRMAVDLYIGDIADFQRAVTVFRGWLGDRPSYAGFDYGDSAWQCDPARPVGINPKGCTRNGYSIDGVLADDQRRAGGFTWPPPKENYVWGGLGGVLAQAVMLQRQGYAAFDWQDRALLRAVQWLHQEADFPAEGDDGWEPHLVNHYYGTNFPAPVPAGVGKNFAWTDWTH